MGEIVGIDVGGTFTDLYLAHESGKVTTIKVPSQPSDPSAGLMHALEAAAVEPSGLDLIVHGTTIATNAVIERKGARVALITTRGFRDVLELGRRDRPTIYGLAGEAKPLVTREWRFEVTERLDAKGQVVAPLDERELTALAHSLTECELDSVVVSFLHAYANPAHERQAVALLQGVNPNWEVVASHEVCNEYFEFERTSTAVIQGYLQPLVAGYAHALRDRLTQARFEAPALIMQSNGGVMPVAEAPQRAARLVRSGPAAGVMAAAQLAAAAGYRAVITGDMGGTSYDVAVVVDGAPRVSQLTQIDFRIPLKVPMIDVHTIGAGGGSIASVDASGIAQVGPRSAGAWPGPACYGNGATEPTVTDANVVLGRIDWARPIGRDDGAVLDIDAARTAVHKFGDALGLSIEAAAQTILALVNQSMAGRTRLLSVEQGLDPRDFTFVCFGGAGPVHGAAIMREVGVARMLIPPDPGVLCAMGCCLADLRNDLSITVEREVGQLGDGELQRLADAQRATGLAQLSTAGIDASQVTVSHLARMCYRGQIHTLRVPFEKDVDADALRTAFALVYRNEFGNTLGDIEPLVVSLETILTASPRAQASLKEDRSAASAATALRTRQVYFGEWTDTPVFERSALLPGMTFRGPAIVEQDDATTVIEPAMTVRVDGLRNLIVEVG